MHNVKQPTASLLDVQKALTLERECLQRKSRGDLSDEAAVLVLELLSKTPMSYTLWNYRRDFLLSQQSSENELTLLIREHHVTSRALEINPKIYPAWEHRLFVFNRLVALMDTPEILTTLQAEEKRFISIKLAEDPKNFHAWNYHRKIFNSMDFAAIYAVLNRDCANHSALHQLSLELHRLHNSVDNQSRESLALRLKECIDFLKLSLSLVPNSESLWQFILKLTDILPAASLQYLIDYIITALEQDGCVFAVESRASKTQPVFTQIEEVYVQPPAIYLLLTAEGYIPRDVDKCQRYAAYCVEHDKPCRNMYTMLLQQALHENK